MHRVTVGLSRAAQTAPLKVEAVWERVERTAARK